MFYHNTYSLEYFTAAHRRHYSSRTQVKQKIMYRRFGIFVSFQAYSLTEQEGNMKNFISLHNFSIRIWKRFLLFPMSFKNV